MSQKEGSTAFVGCVGKDAFGEQLEKSASADGVAVHYAVDEKEATGTCACLISAKERSLIANLAAANKYPLEHMKTEKVAAVLDAAKFVYAAGFFITVSPPTIMHAAEHCQKEGKTFIMNLSAPFITEFFNEPLVAAMAYTDILFGNESEAASFAKKMGWEDVTSEAIALKIHGMKKTEDKKHIVCITQGADATIVVDKEGTVHKFDVPPLKAEDIVDSNGYVVWRSCFRCCYLLFFSSCCFVVARDAATKAHDLSSLLFTAAPATPSSAATSPVCCTARTSRRRCTPATTPPASCSARRAPCSPARRRTSSTKS
jgi:adenosine kinase